MIRNSTPVRRFVLFATSSAAAFGVQAQVQNAGIYGNWQIRELIGGGAASELT